MGPFGLLGASTEDGGVLFFYCAVRLCVCSGALSAVSVLETRLLPVLYPLSRVMVGAWCVVQLSPMRLASWPFCVLAEFVPSVISSRLVTSCAASSIVFGLLQEKK